MACCLCDSNHCCLLLLLFWVRDYCYVLLKQATHCSEQRKKKKTRKEQKVVRCGVPLCRPWLLLSTEDMLGAFLAFLCLRNVKRYHRIMTIYSLISYISWPKPTFQTSINFKTWQKIYTKQVSKYLRIVPDSTDPKIVMVIFFLTQKWRNLLRSLDMEGKMAILIPV